MAAAVQAKVKKFVLVTSIGTDDPLFPLNLLFGVSCTDPHLMSVFQLVVLSLQSTHLSHNCMRKAYVHCASATCKAAKDRADVHF